MKTTYLLIPTLLLAACLSGCGKKQTAAEHGKDGKPEQLGAEYREGKGLELPEPSKKALGLEVTEVTEQKIAPVCKFQVQVYQEANRISQVSSVAQPEKALATGFVTAEQAKQLKPGQPVALETSGQLKEQIEGELVSVGQSATGLPNTTEALVAISDPENRFRSGTYFNAACTGEATGEVTVVPRSALLKTATGTFVYVPNERFFFRTAVKTGAENEEFVEITDGLYAGDSVVKKPVMMLWLAELQAVNGGKACADD